MQTTPLAKAWTTTEGVLVIVADAVLGGAAAIDPSVLPPKVAAVIVGVQHVALLVQRGTIKVNALKQVASIVNSPDPVKSVEELLLADINASAKSATAPTEPQSALAPTPVPPAA